MHTQYCVESRGFVKTNVRRASYLNKRQFAADKVKHQVHIDAT